MFGPGDSDQPSQNIQLFAPKPQEAAPDPNAAAPADGTSASLDGFAKVNSGALKGETPAAEEAAAKDEAAASAVAADAAGAAAGAAGAKEAAGASGSGASTSMLKNTKKLGALSTSFGGGAGGSPTSASNKAGDAAALAATAKSGQLGAMNNSGRGAVASNTRGLGARARNAGAQAQARFARDMGQKNQYSMKGAGKGFESSTAGGAGDPITDANAGGLGGAGAGEGAQPKKFTNPVSGDTKEVEAPIPPNTYDVTPYAKEMQIAQMLVLLAAGLLYYASTLAKGQAALDLAVQTTFDAAVAAASTGVGAAAAEMAYNAAMEAAEANRSLVHYLCIAAGVVGAAVVALGLRISTGAYAQTSQGLLLGAVGGAIIVGAKIAYAGVPSSAVTLIAAGAGLAAMMGGMLMKPKTCKSTEMGNVDKCAMIERASHSPSDRALEQYLT